MATYTRAYVRNFFWFLEDIAHKDSKDINFKSHLTKKYGSNNSVIGEPPVYLNHQLEYCFVPIAYEMVKSG